MTDDATAGILMQQYPAQWDMDRVFQKAYQGYLLQKGESRQNGLQFDSEFSETAECATENGISHKIRRVGGYAALAAVTIGVFLFVFRVSSLRPPTDKIPDGNENNSIATTEFAPDETTDTAEETLPQTTALSEDDPALTTALTSETTASGEERPTETTSSTVGTETSVVGIVIESTLPQTVETVIPGNTETSAAATETTTTESTQETTTTTETTALPKGYFEVQGPSNPGEFFTVRYNRESNTPVEEHNHSFAAEGFWITDEQVWNPGYDYRSVVYKLEDAAGQHYMVRQCRYDYFMPSFNPEYYPLTKSYTIGGRTVFLVYQEDPDSVCSLMWDDGCHVCEINSQYKDLANMELLVLSQTTY